MDNMVFVAANLKITATLTSLVAFLRHLNVKKGGFFISAIMLLNAPAVLSAAPMESRICLSVLGKLHSVRMTIDLNEMNQSLVAPSMEGKFKLAYHFVAGHLRLAEKTGTRLALIVTNSKETARINSDFLLDIVNNDEYHLRNFLRANDSQGVKFYDFAKLEASRASRKGLLDLPLLMVMSEKQLNEFVQSYLLYKRARPTNEALQSFFRLWTAVVELPESHSLNRFIAQMVEPRDDFSGIPLLRIFNKQNDLDQAVVVSEKIESDNFPSIAAETLGPQVAKTRKSANKKNQDTISAAPTRDIGLINATPQPKINVMNANFRQSIFEFKKWVQQNSVEVLKKNLLAQGEYRKFFSALRRKYSSPESLGQTGWWDFFTSQELGKLNQSGKFYLPDEELARIDLAARLPHDYEDRQKNFAIRKIEAWVRAMNHVDRLPEFRRQMQIEEIWFLKWFHQFRIEFPDVLEKQNSPSKPWWSAFSHDTLEILYSTKAVAMSMELSARMGFTHSQRVYIDSKDLKKVANFVAWVTSTTALDLQTLIAQKNLWFGSWFYNLRMKYPTEWFKVFPAGIQEKLFATGKVALPTSLVKDFLVHNLDGTKMEILSANGVSLAMLKNEKEQPLSLVTGFFRGFEIWVNSWELPALTKRVLATDNWYRNDLHTLMETFPGPEINGKPGWWIFFSDACLQKLHQTGKFYFPDQILERLQ